MTEENKAATEEKVVTPAAVVEESKPKKDDKRKEREQLSRRRKGKGRRDRRAREPKEFEESIIAIDRVTRVVKGGRRMRFRVSVVIGDKKGRVGFGIGKSIEVMTGVQKAIAQAKKNLITVPTHFDTIPHPVEAHFKATKVMLFPAPAGKGIIAGGPVRKILELAGVRDVLSKVHGSRNSINITYATLKAIGMLETTPPPGSKKTVEDKTEQKTTEKVEKPEVETNPSA